MLRCQSSNPQARNKSESAIDVCLKLCILLSLFSLTYWNVCIDCLILVLTLLTLFHLFVHVESNRSSCVTWSCKQHIEIRSPLCILVLEPLMAYFFRYPLSTSLCIELQVVTRVEPFCVLELPSRLQLLQPNNQCCQIVTYKIHAVLLF